VRYRRTHDLAELIDLLNDHRIEHPPELDKSIGLTPFAAEMRYDYLPPEPDDEPSFDRAEAVRLAGIAISWASGFRGGT